MWIMEIVVMALLTALPGQSQAPATSVREFVSLSGTVERIDRSTRTLTLRTSSSTTQPIDVPPEVKLFDELRTGDKITVRISEEVIVAVRPGAKPIEAVETTATAAHKRPRCARACGGAAATWSVRERYAATRRRSTTISRID